MKFLQGFGVYIAAVLGVFFSRWWGPYRAGTLTLDEVLATEFLLEIIGAFVGGILAIAIVDAGGAPKGKAKRWKQRAISSFFAGVTIDTLIAGA